MPLPPFLKKYFWEIEFEDLDKERSYYYILERILEYGDIEAVKWILKNYPREQIIEVLRTSRVLSKKSANLWAFYLEIPKEKILCFQKQFRENSRAIWNR